MEKERFEKDEYYYIQEIAKAPANQELDTGYKEWLEKSIQKDIESKDYHRRTLSDKQQKLSFLKAQDEEDYNKMQRIASQCSPNWLAIVSRPPIVNCGRNDPAEYERGQKWWQLAQNCHAEKSYDEWLKNNPSFRMEFVCTKKWNEMNPTENRRVRFCGDCKKNVYFCENIVEARELGYQGCCIGIDVGVKRTENEDGVHDLVGELAIFGRPSAKHVEDNKTRLMPDRISAKRIMKRVELNMCGKSPPGPTELHDYRD